MNKLFRVLELLWLFTAIAAALVAVYFLVINDRDGALFFIFAFLTSAVLYLLRRYQRKRHESFQSSKNKK